MINPDIRTASTLPSAYYTDPGLFAEIRERAFARSWQWVMDTDGLKTPGTVVPFRLLPGLLEEPMVAIRDTHDELRVLSNVCTHRGMTVCEGAGNERFLRCRYHGRRFGLDGKFQHMPEFDGVEDFPSEADNLPAVPFGVWAKFLFASVSPTASLEETLQPMIDRIGWLPLHEFRFAPERAREYMVQANWALYIDNYLEGLHIPFIHADLNSVIDYENYTTEHFAGGNLQLAVASSGEHAFDLPATSPDYGKRIGAYYYWLFPNLMFNFYPWGLSINVVRPLAPDRTKVSFIPYVWDETKLGSGAGAALDRVEREDETVVEAVQIGVRSRFYDRGRYSATREQNVHQFHRLLLGSLAPDA
jgi:choline monooxygenase